MTLLGFLRGAKTEYKPIALGTTQRDILNIYVLEDIHDEDEDLRPTGFTVQGNVMHLQDADRAVSVVNAASNSIDAELEDGRLSSEEKSIAKQWLASLEALRKKISTQSKVSTTLEGAHCHAFSESQAARARKKVKVPGNVSTSTLRKGMNVEREHASIGACHSPTLAAKIAAAHLRERPDYYTMLAKFEK